MLNYVGIGIGSIIALFVLYVVIRLSFKAIFRSYFEEKSKQLSGGKSNGNKG